MIKVKKKWKKFPKKSIIRKSLKVAFSQQKWDVTYLKKKVDFVEKSKIYIFNKIYINFKKINNY